MDLSDLLAIKRLFYYNDYSFTFIFDDIHHLMNSIFGAELNQFCLCIIYANAFAFTFEVPIHVLWLNLLSFIVIETVRHFIMIRVHHDSMV